MVPSSPKKSVNLAQHRLGKAQLIVQSTLVMTAVKAKYILKQVLRGPVSAMKISIQQAEVPAF
jgi:hypothetical protein